MPAAGVQGPASAGEGVALPVRLAAALVLTGFALHAIVRMAVVRAPRHRGEEAAAP